MAGVRSRKAEASTRRTPLRRYKSHRADSSADSAGLWMKLKPWGVSPKEPRRRSMACSTRAGERPAAPKKQSSPALAPASTKASEAMPLAMAPVA